ADDGGVRAAHQLRAVRRGGRAPTPAAGRGALASHEVDLKTAEAALAESVGLLRDVPMPLAQCRTLTAYGAVLGRRGSRDRARQLLSDALARARGCGAGWHAPQAPIALRPARGPGRRPPPGP